MEEQDEVLGGPRVLVQVQIHFSVVDDGVVGLDVGDGVLGIQDLDEGHLDYSKELLQRRLTVVLRSGFLTIGFFFSLSLFVLFQYLDLLLSLIVFVFVRTDFKPANF